MPDGPPPALIQMMGFLVWNAAIAQAEVDALKDQVAALQALLAKTEAPRA
jgi:cell division protein FtsB